jgi:16S rRNA (uracil1498-N3)-methyltransferase
VAGVAGPPGAGPEGPGPAPADRTAGPDPRLIGAAAMVFVEDPAVPVLTEGDVHHLLDVLRLRPGESVAASDGRGSWVPCRLTAAPGGRGSGKVDAGSVLVADGPLTTTVRLEPVLTVAFAPTKGDRPEWVTQKLTELGVDRIVPLRARRSVVRWDGERGRRAVERLRRVAREASAQSRRTWLPEVTAVMDLDALTSEFGLAPSLAQPGGGPPSLARPLVAVGPEGGWDEDELSRFGGATGLGPNVLRAETAAVAAGAILCALRVGIVDPLA